MLLWLHVLHQGRKRNGLSNVTGCGKLVQEAQVLKDFGEICKYGDKVIELKNHF